MNPNTLLLPDLWPRAERTSVNRCLLLALLLQVWLVLTFGNAPGGSARPGEGVWGAVNVTLRGPARAGPPATAAPAPPAVATGPTGKAKAERWGGVVRESTPLPPSPEPGAARLGHWAQQAAPQPAQAALPRATGEALPRLPEVPSPGAPAQVVRQLNEGLRAPPLPATQALSTVPAAPPVPTLATLPELSAPPAQPLMAPRPALPRTAAPVAALPSNPPLLAPPTSDLSALKQPLPGPAAVPLSTVATLPKLAPPLPAVISAPLSPQVQPPLARFEELATPLPPMATLNAPAPAPAPTPALTTSTTPTAPMATTAPTGDARSAASPQAPALAPALLGAPDAGTQLGHDVATAPSQPASAPPRLNLQLPRQYGGELSRGMGGGLLAVVPRPPEVDSKLGQQIRKSAKTDCRQAYAAAGLLAVVPLAVDALKAEGDCKW